MTQQTPVPPVFPRAKRLRFAGTVLLVLWIVTIVTFVVAVTAHANDRMLAALGGLASVLFAGCFGLQAVASRREWRELTEQVQRDDLRASRSRR
jgi:cobalamin biosynthesis protein CobD/CbiB